MADNLFARSPAEIANAEGAARRQQIMSEGLKPLAPEKPDLSTFSDIAAEYQVPRNVIEAVVEAAPLADKSQTMPFAAEFASRLGPELARGLEMKDAMQSIFGKDAPVDDLLNRAIDLRTKPKGEAARADGDTTMAERPGNFLTDMYSGALSSAGSAAKALGFEETAGDLSAEAEKYAPPVQSYKDVDNFGEAVRYVSGGIAQSIPEMGAVFAAGLATAASGGTALLAGAAALGTSTIFNAGRAAERQEAEGADEIDWAKAWGAGTAMGALDAVTPGKISGQVANAFSRRAAGAAATSAAKRGLTEEILQDATTEGVTEVLQQMIEVGQADPDLLRVLINPTDDELEKSDQLLTEMIDSAIVGGFAGGAFSAGGATARKIIELRKDAQADDKGGEEPGGADLPPEGGPAPTQPPAAAQSEAPTTERPPLGPLSKAAMQAPATLTQGWQPGAKVKVTNQDGVEIEGTFVEEKPDGILVDGGDMGPMLATYDSLQSGEMRVDLADPFEAKAAQDAKEQPFDPNWATPSWEGNWKTGSGAQRAQPQKAPRKTPVKLEKRPFTNTLKAAIGGIDPEGPAGLELKARGITPQSTPGLFVRGGVKNLDNLPAAEWGGLQYEIGVDETENYLSEQGVFDAIEREYMGIPVQDADQRALQEEQDAKEEAKAQGEANNAAPMPAEKLGEVQDNIPPQDEDISTGEERANMVRAAIQRAMSDMGIANLTQGEYARAARILDQVGGDPQDAVSDAIAGEQRDAAPQEPVSAVDDEPLPGFDPMPLEGGETAPDVQSQVVEEMGAEGVAPPPSGPSASSPTENDLQIANNIPNRWNATLPKTRRAAVIMGLKERDDVKAVWSDKAALESIVAGELEARGIADMVEAAPREEPGADGKPQAIVPGAEQSAEQAGQAEMDRAKAETDVRAKQSKMRTAAPQDAPGGLFDTQADMFDAPAPTPVAESTPDAKPVDGNLAAETGDKPVPSGGTVLAAMQDAVASGIVEHTTQRGKKLQGYVAKGVTPRQAKRIDRYAFKKDGGWFIRDKDARKEYSQLFDDAALSDENQKDAARINAALTPKNKDGLGYYIAGRDTFEIDALGNGDAEITITTSKSQYKGKAKVTSENNRRIKFSDVRENLSPEAIAAVEEVLAFDPDAQAAAPEPEQPEYKLLGKNRRGNDVFEDRNGVRSYVERGIRVSESVNIIPGQGAYVDENARSSEFKPVENEILPDNVEDVIDFTQELVSKNGQPVYKGTKYRLSEDPTLGWRVIAEQQDPRKVSAIESVPGQPWSQEQAIEAAQRKVFAQDFEENPARKNVEGRGLLEDAGMVQKTTGEKIWVRKQAEPTGVAVYRAKAIWNNDAGAHDWALTKDFRAESGTTPPPTQVIGSSETAANAVRMLAEAGMRTGTVAEADTAPKEQPAKKEVKQEREPKKESLYGDTTTQNISLVKIDNPGGEWLSGKIRSAERQMKEADPNTAVAHGLVGSQTAYTKAPVMIQVSEIASIQGAMGETPAPGKAKFDALMSSVEKDGFSNESPILIGVNHLGEAYIVEGNNRLAVAKSINLDAIAAEIRWYNGGEAVDGKFSPGNILNIAEAITSKEASATKKKSTYGANNKLVSADRAAELRERLKVKLQSQINSGIDPEIMAIGAELAVFHIEAGARKFTDLATAIANDLGTETAKLRPYLRSWYNGARDMMEDNGLSIEGMDGPDEVRAALAEMDTPKADEPVRWADAKVGDKVRSGQYIAARSLRYKWEADGMAAALRGGYRMLDGANRFAVTSDQILSVEESEALLKAVRDGRREASQPTSKPRPDAAAREARIEREVITDTFERMLRDGETFPTINKARSVAKDLMLRDLTDMDLKVVEETFEAAVVRRARAIANNKDMNAYVKYDAMVKLYQAQPKLAQRTSTSIEQQAYSTPAPLAFLASRLAGVDNTKTVYEPSAGNGMLLMEAAEPNIRANELNEERYAQITREYPEADISLGDAMSVELPSGSRDVIIANPPFGKVKDADRNTVKFDLTGQDTTTSEIDHAIAFKALDAMKDDGRAVLIVGGHQGDADARKAGYRGAQPRKFYKRLYDTYNVTEHFTVDGKLYERQGAGWPVDVIVIEGRKPSQKPYPMREAPELYTSWDQLGDRINGEMGNLDPRGKQPERGDGLVQTDRPERDQGGVERGKLQNAPVSQDRPGAQTGVEGQSGEAVSPGRLPVGIRQTGVQPDGPAEVFEPGRSDGGKQRAPENELRDAGRDMAGGPQQGDGRQGSSPVSERRAGNVGNDIRNISGDAGPVTKRKKHKRENTEAETAFQVQYEPRSTAKFAVGTLVPRNMQDAANASLEKLEERVGDIDDFVAGKLGYTRDEMLGTDTAPGKFSAEQVDALALAISHIENGKAFIIGDQTGVGKGRINAGLIRYAMKAGRTPVFFTVKPGLYGDMVRDLRDIGEKRPEDYIFMTNGDLRGRAQDGTPKFIPLSDKPGDKLESMTRAKYKAAMDNLRDTGKLPIGKKVVFTTYDQMNTVKGKETDRMRAMQNIAPNAFFIFDESHNAGGTEQTRKPKPGDPEPRSVFIRKLIGASTFGTFFSSATFAKNPAVMSLYFKTNITEAVSDLSKLGDIVAKGGVPLQQVMSNQLVQDGQYLRRERTYDGIEMNMEQLPTTKEIASVASTSLREIFNLDNKVMKDVRGAYVEEELSSGNSGVADNAVGDQGAQSTGFSSTMHNAIGQVLLAMKADAVVDKAIEAHKRGEKPIIALTNTNDSVIDDFAKDEGIEINDPINITFNALMRRYVQRLRQVTIKVDDGTPDGGVRRVTLTDEDVASYGGPAALDELKRVEAFIDNADFGNMPASPIDYITERLEDAGVKVGEITGRGKRIQKGVYVTRTKGSGANKTAMNAYNNGGLDALIINESGATGFSMHATKDNDGKVRHMFVLQPHPNIDTFMQMLGRINRTGQIKLPKYTIAVSDLAIEKRPAAVLMRKMASLNANTTASKDSAVSLSNVTDFMNKYGDAVVMEYLRENPEIAVAADVAIPKKKSEASGIAAKFTGRLAIFPPDRVAQIFDDIEASYNGYIAELDSMGQNSLEAKTLELEARTINSTVISQGSNPDSAFGADTVLEDVDVKILGKPMTPEQVQEQTQKVLGNKTEDQWVQEQLERISKQAPLERADLEAGRKVIEDAAKLAKTEKQKAAAADRMNRLNDRINQFDKKIEELKNLVYNFRPGRPVIVTMRNGSEVTDRVYGVTLGIDLTKMKGSLTAFSRAQTRVALANPTRELRLPASRFVGEDAALDMTNANEGSVMRAFETGQAEAREQRQIVTGNIIGGLEKFGKGQIIMFTREDGSQDQGILLPADFDAQKALEERPVVFADLDQAMEFVENVGSPNAPSLLKSEDGALTVQRSYDGVILTVQKRGGKPYVLNPTVREMVGDFVTRSGPYKKTISRESLRDVLNTYQEQLGAVFIADAHKDQARKITGEELPEFSSTEVKGKRRNLSNDRAETYEGRDTVVSTPATVERLTKLRQRIRDELKKTGIDAKIKLKVVKNPIVYKGKTLDGYFSENVIGVSETALDGGLNVARHEIIHALRSERLWGASHGLFLPQEWRALVAAARANTKLMARIKDAYPELTSAQQYEEAIAELYVEWSQAQDAKGIVSRAFDKMRRVLDALIEALKGQGAPNAERVLQNIRDGRIGWRSQSQPRDAQGRFLPSQYDIYSMRAKWSMNAAATLKRKAFTFTDARRLAKAFQGKTLTNADSGIEAVVSGGNIGKMLSAKAVSKSSSAKLQAQVVANVDDVFRSAIYGWEKADTKVDSNITKVHRLFAPVVAANGKAAITKLTVKETVQKTSNNPIYSVESVELSVNEPSTETWADATIKADGIDPTSNPSAEGLRTLAQAVADFNNRPDPEGPKGRRKSLTKSGPAGFERAPFVKSAGYKSGAKQLISTSLTNAMAGNGKVNLLALVPGRALIAELGRNIPAAQKYLRLKEKMDTLRNELHAKTDELAQEWRKIIGKNPEANVELMKLMHDSTLAEQDPSKPYLPEAMPRDAELVRRYKPNTKTHKDALARIEKDKVKKAAYDKLKGRFDALPKEFRDMYGKVRDAYSEQADAFEKAIEEQAGKAMSVAVRRAKRDMEQRLEQIADDGLEGQAKAEAEAEARADFAKMKMQAGMAKNARLSQLRSRFEDNKINGPYFPLARFGEFFVTLRNDKGKVVSYSQFESAADQATYAAEMRKEGYQVQEGVTKDSSPRDSVDPGFVADIEGMLSDIDADEQLMDAIWQRWLQTLPDMSVRKSRIHRKGRAGFDRDAFRAFGRQMFHGAHQLARLKYALDMGEEIKDAYKEASEAKDPVRSTLIVKEIDKRHEYTMNPKGTALAQAMTSAAFVYYLGMTPAAAVVNLSQTTVVGIPILSAFYGKNGTRKAASQLTKAMQDFASGKGHAVESDRLNAEEKDAMTQAYEMGTIDKSQSHDLAGVGETGVEYSAVRTKVMGVISWMFHHTERMNREVTYLAAYRMARDKGLNHENAIRKAADLTWKTHFDYANTSRPRLLQNDALRVALVFKNFQINMLWRLFRDTHQVFKGATPEVRREARAQLAGITGQMLLHAGVKGVWGYSLMLGLLSLAFGEDREELEKEMEKAITSILPSTMSSMLLDGVPGALTGTDLRSRIGMPDLWFRSSNRALEGEDEYQYYVNQMLGATFGIGERIARGLWQVGEGEVYRGIETMVPKMIRDAMRSGRYMFEGARTYNDDPLVEKFTAPELAAQLMGFTPARLSERYDQNSRMKNREKAITKKRRAIMRDAGMSIIAGKPVPKSVLDAIEAFNKDYPVYPITPKSLRQSVNSRIRAKNRNEFGIQLNPKLNSFIRDDEAPTRY